jgi:hypothetical protein
MASSHDHYTPHASAPIPGGVITYGPETGVVDPQDGQVHQTFAVHWTNVDRSWREWGYHQPLCDTFSLYLFNRNDRGPGDFDIAFVYDGLTWDTSDDYGGEDGLANPPAGQQAYPARAGFTNGTERPGTFVNLEGSGEPYGLISGEHSLVGLTKSWAVKNLVPHLAVTDLAANKVFTDLDKGVTGVVADSAGNAQLHLALGDLPVGSQNTIYTYNILDASDNVINAGTISAMTPVIYIATQSGLHTIRILRADDPNLDVRARYYLAKVDIRWDAPNDAAINNIRYTGGTSVMYYDKIAGRSINIYTGQLLGLTYLTDVPAGMISAAKWVSENIEQDMVKDYVVQNTGSAFTYPIRNARDSNTATVVQLSSSDLIHPQLAVYGVADNPGRVFTIDLKIKVGGDTFELASHVTINIHKPGQSIWSGPSPYSSAGLPDYFQVEMTQRPGHMEPGCLIGAESNWCTSPTRRLDGYEGKIHWVQLVSGKTGAFFAGVPIWYSGPGDEYMLDNTYPYDNGKNAETSVDSPALGTDYATSVFIHYRFRDWLTWTPPGTYSISVPIQQWSWMIRTSASIWSGHWVASPIPADVLPIFGADTNEFPIWSHLWQNNGT